MIHLVVFFQQSIIILALKCFELVFTGLFTSKVILLFVAIMYFYF